MRSIFALICSCTLLTCDKTSLETRPPESEDLAEILRDFEANLARDIITDSINGSISAAIVREDRVIWSKAIGHADPRGGVLADTSTLYRAGSISKTFTAFLMMRLVEEGTIELTDAVDLYVPEIRQLPGYSDSTRITLSQLASHTAGLSREPQLEDANKGPIDGWENKLLASIPTAYFQSRPGAKYEYSNIGYGILGLAVSRAAGKPFIQLMQEKVFSPLGMTHTFYIVPENFETKLAVGMDGGPFEGIDLETPKAEHQGRGYKVPNGGIYSTPNDLAKFMIDNLGYGSLLKKSGRETMQTEKGPQPNKYGLGFMVFRNNEVDIVGHNGRMAGYTAQFAFERRSEFGVILMRNYTHGATDLDMASFVLLTKLIRVKSE